jgi:hypothetical protein
MSPWASPLAGSGGKREPRRPEPSSAGPGKYNGLTPGGSG